MLCSGWREGADGNRHAVLAVLPAAAHPTPETLNRLAHEWIERRTRQCVGGASAGTCARHGPLLASPQWLGLSPAMAKPLLTAAGSALKSSPAQKLVLFTEHRDTLDYLEQRITTLLGRKEAVVCIHGGMGRKEHMNAQESFRHDPEVKVSWV